MGNNTKTAAFKAASKLNTAKVKAGAKDIAKGKAPSKAELARKANERAIASAAKELAKCTMEQATDRFVRDELKVEGSRNVYAMAMNNRFAFTLENGGHHWSAIWTSKNAKQPGSNLRAVWEAIDAEYETLKSLLTSGTRKHSNPAKVWQRARERAFEIAFPGQKRAPRQNDTAPADAALEKLVAAYKVVAKETVQTERDERLVDAIGRLLVAFNIDLAKINAKIDR